MSHELVNRPFVPSGVQQSLPALTAERLARESETGPDPIRLEGIGLIFSRMRAAEALDLSPHEMDKLRRRGEIEFYKVGARVYFTESQLVSFVKGRIALSQSSADKDRTNRQN